MQFLILVLRLILIVAIQVFLLNEIYLGQLIVPSIYLLFLIKLPFEIKPWALLFWGFVLGFSLDIITGTYGINSSAVVAAAFMGPWIIQLVSGRKAIEAQASPSVKDMGLRWFLTYATLLVIVHQTVLFFVEAFGFSFAPYTLLKIFFSSILSIALIILSEYLFFKPRG